MWGYNLDKYWIFYFFNDCFDKKYLVVINPITVANQIPRSLIITITDVATDNSTPDSIIKPTKLNSVNPMPAGRNDNEPSKIEDSVTIVVNAISKFNPNAVKIR